MGERAEGIEPEFCTSTYREGGWVWRCHAKGPHDKHHGWTTGRTRDWTDEEAER